MRDVHRARNSLQFPVVAADTTGDTCVDAPLPQRGASRSMNDKAAAAVRPFHRFLSTDQQWGAFLALVLFLKFCLLLVDPSPKFYMGDSGSYISTATSGTIPPDRSFVYGYVVRALAVWPTSLTPLLLCQALLSGATAIMVAVICRSIFCLSPRSSYFFGLVSCLDPLQLVWERYVMTEAISLFIYVLFLYYCLRYVRDHRISDLIFIQVIGVILLAFRLSYLLVIQVTTVLLPLIAFLPTLAPPRRRFGGLLTAVLWRHLAISIVLMLGLHHGYKQLNGGLFHSTPEYGYNTGLHLLAVWAPALEPTDAIDARLARVIANGKDYQIANLDLRNSQRFSRGYLVDRWLTIESNPFTANEIGRRTALRAFQHRPLQILDLGFRTYLEFWNRRSMRIFSKLDLGHDMTKDEVAILAQYFHWAGTTSISTERPTLLQKYFLRSWPYCLFALTSPLLGLLTLVVRSQTKYAAILFVHATVLVAVITVFTVNPSVRYVQPISVLTILLVALLAGRFLQLRPIRSDVPLEALHRV